MIGAGVVAPLHLEAIAALDDAELIGIAALDAAEAAARAERFGCAWFADHRELLALAPDVVVVCTPHPSHPQLTIESLEAGAHVLCEKPLAAEVREADAMIAAADRLGRLLGVCFQQRFRPVIAAAHELVAEGRLGEFARVSIVDPLYRPNAYYRTAGWRGTWDGEGGGVLMNQAPHTLDLLCHLAARPARVWGVSRRGAQPMEAEDTATALLEYANGALGTLAVSTTEPGVQRIELVGDRGRIEIVGESLAFERFEPPVSEHLPAATGMFDQPELVREEVTLPTGKRRPRDGARGLRRRDPRRLATARAGARRALLARARECDRALDAHASGGAAAGRPRRVRGAARRSSHAERHDGLIDLIAFGDATLDGLLPGGRRRPLGDFVLKLGLCEGPRSPSSRVTMFCSWRS